MAAFSPKQTPSRRYANARFGAPKAPFPLSTKPQRKAQLGRYVRDVMAASSRADLSALASTALRAIYEALRDAQSDLAKGDVYICLLRFECS